MDFQIYQSTIFDSSSYDHEDTNTKHIDLITGLINMYNRIVTSSYDRSIKFWDIKKNKCIKKVDKVHDKKIQSLLKINKSCFMSYQQDYLFFWNCKQMKIMKKISIFDLKFNPQYEICVYFSDFILINTTSQNQIFCVDILNNQTSNEEFKEFPNRLSSFLALDKTYFAIGHNYISVYEFKTKTIKQNIEYTSKGYDELSLVKLNKTLLAAGSMHGYILVINWKLGTTLHNVYRNGPLVKQLFIFENKKQENYVVSVNRDRSIQIWNYKLKKQIQTFFMDRQGYLFTTIGQKQILSVDKIRDIIQIRSIK